MNDNFMQTAMDLAKQQAGVRALTPTEIGQFIQDTATMLEQMALANNIREDSAPAIISVMDPKKSIKENSITCVVCGQQFKVLTAKHLQQHGLTPESYRELCGYKKDTALVSKALQKSRRERMQENRIWERAPQNKDKQTPIVPDNHGV